MHQFWLMESALSFSSVLFNLTSTENLINLCTVHLFLCP
jgi:hypothetical protein